MHRNLEYFGIVIEDYQLVLLSVFAISGIIQLLYYYLVLVRVAGSKAGGDGNVDIPVSVVICARKEESNIRENLPLVLEQDYPDFEVMVVDDCSMDNTPMVLSELKAKYSNLKFSSIPLDKKFTHGKKLALTVGIKGATRDIILLTDADCKPASKHWIARMVSNYRDNTDIVLAYGPYARKRGVLNNLIRFDTFFAGLQYLGMALAGAPYMGVGRNLSYRKELFFKHKGFASHSHIASGDDDLFINKAASKKNIAVELHPDSFVYSEASPKLGSWLKQKKRHLTTAPAYNGKTKFFLGLEVMSRFLFYLSFVFLLIDQAFLYPVLGWFGVRLITMVIVFKLSMARLKEKNLLLPSLLYDILLPIINLFLYISNVFTRRNSNKWM